MNNWSINCIAKQKNKRILDFLGLNATFGIKLRHYNKQSCRRQSHKIIIGYEESYFYRNYREFVLWQGPAHAQGS